MRIARPETPSLLSLLADREASFTETSPELTALETIEEVNRQIPMPEIPTIPLSELNGLTVFEQFLLVWGTPERGAILWQMWQSQCDDFTRQMLNQLAQSTADELQLTLDEAKRRLAVEKVLSDVGPDYAVRFLESYRNYTFTQSRPLKPMELRSTSSRRETASKRKR